MPKEKTKNKKASVCITTTTRRVYEQYDYKTAIRTICEKNGIDYSTGALFLDGTRLGNEDYDKALRDFCVADKCALTMIPKMGWKE